VEVLWSAKVGSGCANFMEVPWPAQIDSCTNCLWWSCDLQRLAVAVPTISRSPLTDKSSFFMPSSLGTPLPLHKELSNVTCSIPLSEFPFPKIPYIESWFHLTFFIFCICVFSLQVPVNPLLPLLVLQFLSEMRPRVFTSQWWNCSSECSVIVRCLI
jgi:hypothetical protein